MKVNNICFTYITPFHPDRGGIGKATHTLTLEFKKLGYNVFYLIYPCAITKRHEYDYPCSLEYLPSSDCFSEENVAYYKKYLRRNKIDVVINQSGNFSDSRLWVKAREWGVKVISVLHSQPQLGYSSLWYDISTLRNDGFKEKIKRFVRILLYPKLKSRYIRHRESQFDFLLPNTDIVVTLSPVSFDKISELKPGYEYKYRSIPNPNSYEDHLISKSKTKQLLFVGLFGVPKMENWLVDIWGSIYKDFPDWKLVIVGGGSKEDESFIRKKAKKYERIEFVGLKPALRFHQESSILCLTSLYEGWPMVVTEAMQCGTVPIAFASFDAILDIIQDGRNGVLVTPYNIKEYKSKLRTLMLNEEMRETLSYNAKKDVSQYNVENIIKRWEQLFTEL